MTMGSSYSRMISIVNSSRNTKPLVPFPVLCEIRVLQWSTLIAVPSPFRLIQSRHLIADRQVVGPLRVRRPGLLVPPHSGLVLVVVLVGAQVGVLVRVEVIVLHDFALLLSRLGCQQ